jgi:L-threonylcarbamoyladenylate synthase
MSPQEALVAGKVIAIPTDTVYGLACLPDKAGAVDAIFEMKKRPRDLGLPVLCADLRQAAQYGRLPGWAGRGWPGPVTLIVRRTAASAGWHLGGPESTVGMRVPDQLLVQGIAAELGPLAATSANIHGGPSPETAEGVLDLFGEVIELAVDGGNVAGAPSTVVDCVSSRPRVLRQGSMTLSALLG